ncbi:hypothetical protein ACYJ1Y_08285 [Natrialbaceae archaeon A-gly3]
MSKPPRTAEDEIATERGRNSGLSRRSYVRSLAAVAAATTSVAAIGTTTADDDDDYELVELEAGERRVVEVGDGETLENTVYDQSADGAQAVISATGTDWTVRNVGFKGKISGKDAQFGVADTGNGTSTIENVYVGDGAEDGHRVGLGIWVTPEHNGHLDIERVNVQEMGDNSFYCSAPGSAGGGTVDIDRCYSANSWVSHFRLAEGSVTNSVAVNDESHKDGRGVWAWPSGPVEVRDCHLAMNGRHYSIVAGAKGPSQVDVYDTEYDTGYHGGVNEPDGGTVDLRDGNGTDPEDIVPEGCPTSPEEAATGGN